ncbi:nucleotide-binding protein [Aquimarina gracilis]|uniref:Nucleotide-binding protein n=1 Tax=Aquimarina gracilis TaxID=874422 RepID=A0ABU5ZR59_9FLAO|nr:nucleotide-binding protein [Aquimarina gracilis]MEB3344561.1 nucleotide-binding protein [Aquimarina gracilis]
MKILFQGGWKQKRDLPENKLLVEEYCKYLAKKVAHSRHTIVLTSNRDCDSLIAHEISKELDGKQELIKERVLFLLPDRTDKIPKLGTVHKFGKLKWWQEERTYIIQQVEALIAIGGGKGTSDCIQKAILANLPVFVSGQIDCLATETWKQRPANYKYIQENDTLFTEDLNTTPDLFCEQIFEVLDKEPVSENSRNIFIVHGRDHYERDKLVNILKKLDFHPIVLDKEPNTGLTIIEKLERDINNVGFGFILYTPDDIGGLKGDIPGPRARQNVIFEHGYLFGLLGRNRTCALLKGEIEFPSDLNGVINEKYIDLGQESLKIAKILKDAGYRVDAGNLI